MASLTVGFDLDMTLVDPRAGVVATMAALAAETGVPIDGAAAAARLGPPLEIELAHWFPAADIDERARRYRELARTIMVPMTVALPGAGGALAAVRANGGRVLVVTAKSRPLAEQTLAQVGFAVDEVVGGLWAHGKAGALRASGAGVYVGDHLGDVVAARAGGAVAVGVASGPVPAEQLTAAGADAVLPDLTGFPDWLAGHLLPGRLPELDRQLRELDSVLVAFSGGADSALLLAAAVRALGADRVVAATAISSSLATGERERAARFAAGLGVPHRVVATREMDRAGYRANGPDRCWFCKAELLDVLRPEADRLGLRHVLTGTNADDAVAGFRPGIGAAAERGARTPLRDAGLTKAQVRLASREWGLPTWDKPAAACLSSRIAYGVSITPARLARVDRAELALRTACRAAGLAVRDLRVRDLGDRARVEVDAELAELLAGRPDLLSAVEGFEAVEVDPRGFRSGSMNDGLTAAAGRTPAGGR